MEIMHVVPQATSNPLLWSIIGDHSADAVVISLGASGELEDEAQRRGSVCVSLGLVGRGPRQQREFASALRRFKPDVVECHSLLPSWFGAVSAVSQKARPTIVSVRHHNLNHHLQLSRPGRWQDRFIAQMSDHSVAVSFAVRDTLLAEGLSPHRVTAVPNALLEEFLPQDHCAHRDQRTTTEVRLLAVGRLDWQKDYPTMFHVMRQVVDAGREARLRVVGQGSLEYSRFLKTLVHRLDLDQYVDFVGYSRDVDAHMRWCDVFLHTAQDEAFGLVLLEALFAGLPIVSTPTGGAREILASHGTLAKSHSVDDITSKLLQVIDESHTQERLSPGERRARLLEQFSPLRMSAQHLEVCHRVNAEQRRSPRRSLFWSRSPD